MPARRRLGTAIAPPQVTKRLRAAAGLSEVEGLLVRHVEEGSPAERAGLLRGDVLVRGGEIALTSIDALYEALDLEGEVLQLVIVRATEELTVPVTF